jgi:transposase
VLLTVIANLSKQKVMNMNLRHAISYAGSSARDFLPVPKYFSEMLGGQIEELRAELFGIVKKLFPKEYACLVSVPGISDITASALLVSTNGMKNFAGHKQLSSYLGLVPSVRQSGISVKGKGRVSKCGSDYVRSLLYMCAMSAARYSPSMAGFYTRLIGKGKEPMVALVAAAHRLVRIAFGVVRSGEPYRGFRKEVDSPT